ncbi:MAG: hypothetical protein AAF721_03435 [Myxococcota bacterium]
MPTSAAQRALFVAVIFAPSIAAAAPAPAPGQETTAPAALAPGQAPPVQTPDPVDTTTEPEADEPALPVVESAAPATTTKAPAVDDAAWQAIQGRQVVVQTAGGPIEGELAESAGDTLVLVQDNGHVITLAKSKATGVRVVKDAPPPESPKDSMAGLETEPEAKPEAAEEGEEEEELTKGQERRKKRREEREHAILGAFTMQGATYSHWRGDGINAGHASYAMDFGVGGNFSPRFGLYAMAGGLLGARIDDKSTKANYGHVAALFVFGGKYYYSTVGAGVAFSRLRFEDDRLQKDRGLALPFKLMAKIPLPKKLYIGLGLTYELAMVRGFSRFVNAIGGQIVFGRW